MNEQAPNTLPPPPGALPANADEREVVAVQIPIETYKEMMAILQELPYKTSAQVMNKLAPGVQAVFAPEVDDEADGGAE